MEKKLSYGIHHDLNLKTLIALTRARNALAQRSGALFKACGLTTMQFAVLEVLYHKGDLSIGEATRKILATGGNMTVVVQNLQKQGLIEKKCDPKDQRVQNLHITEKGKEKVAKIFPQHLEQLEGQLQLLTDQDKKDLIRIVKKIQN